MHSNEWTVTTHKLKLEVFFILCKYYIALFVKSRQTQRHNQQEHLESSGICHSKSGLDSGSIPGVWSQALDVDDFPNLTENAMFKVTFVAKS